MSDQNEDKGFEKNRIKWEFFKLHANQRITFFRFYIGLVIALFVAYFYILEHLQNCQGTRFLYFCLLIAGAGISTISCMFYKLDVRNIELIQNVKNILPEIVDLSSNDPQMSYTHRKIFKIAFFVTFSLGIVLSFLGFYKYGYDRGRCGLVAEQPSPQSCGVLKYSSSCDCKGEGPVAKPTEKKPDVNSSLQPSSVYPEREMSAPVPLSQ